VPFFTTLHGISSRGELGDHSTAAYLLRDRAIVLGLLSDGSARRNHHRLQCGCGTITWIPILFFPGTPLWLLIFLVIIVGCANGSVTSALPSRRVRPAAVCRYGQRALQHGSILGAMILSRPSAGCSTATGRGASPRSEDLRPGRLPFGFSLIIVLSALSALQAP